MSNANLTVVELTHDGDDTIVVVAPGTNEDRFFSPILAAQVMIDVGGLVHQSCYSRPEPRGGLRAKEGNPRGPRKWAFAQEIFSNEGRGTESGHFLEHLVLEMALNAARPGRPRRFAGETTWNWREEPDRFRLRFFNMDEEIVRTSLSLSSRTLAKRDYILDLGSAAHSDSMILPRSNRAIRVAR